MVTSGYTHSDPQGSLVLIGFWVLGCLGSVAVVVGFANCAVVVVWKEQHKHLHGLLLWLEQRSHLHELPVEWW